jgi:predicted NBD/HSP70 family sugar kinase
MLTTKLEIRPGLLVTESPDTPADRVSEKRRIRKHQVLEVIRRHGPIPRVDVARILGFNVPSVSTLVDELVRDNLVMEDEAKKTSIGRRPIPVSLNANAACVIGVDVGKIGTIGLIMNLAGEILGRIESASPGNMELEAFTDWIEEFIDKLINAQESPIIPLAGVGIGLPGLVYQRHSGRQLRLQPQVEQIRDRIQSALGIPVIVDNDARMMAFGVNRFGNESGYDNMAIINLGFGLGMGLIIDGHIYQGFHCHAGELGHVPLGEAGVPWYTGTEASLENIASGSGLERLAAKHGLLRNGQPLRSVELADMARAGNATAKEIFDEFASALARGLGTVINLFNPQAVVLAGRVSRSASLFEKQLREELKKFALPIILEETDVIISDLHENAGSLGTCACVLHHIYSASHISVRSII